MASRRDWLLQQLGITQWTLYRPTVLRGDVTINLPKNIRLLIVAQSLPNCADPVLCDVLLSLHLTPWQTYSLTPYQAMMLPKETQCNSWRLGIDEPLAVEGVQLYSPALVELYQDVHAKRALWQQICQYEADFYPDASRSGACLPD
ncbi:DNA polymerase III subunit psi [Candidatus Fukatsuia symbiotica]|uniref:DNA polymerase III subunit psi n=1 Tax=Candidatus Fukatsuia symbiotica TaxID=1878942 RepID=A0A2U8I4E7_9GAMM|nr:DNA polymerase III subunit psi [Candidatus Fukatsuia symbiotica]AWK14021.1 DNA polymerase III subunit psi [Candidatus Fukatsuia symbiotica]MEA9445625.1 DNA polymerase III subunit psi [Candidatus Fukatsuia symbiotica]